MYYWAGVFILSVPVCLLIFGFFPASGMQETLSAIDFGNTFHYRLWKHISAIDYGNTFQLQSMETLSAKNYGNTISALDQGNTFSCILWKHFPLQTRETLSALDQGDTFCHLLQTMDTLSIWRRRKKTKKVTLVEQILKNK